MSGNEQWTDRLLMMAQSPQASNFGLRQNGTNKGQGWLGTLPLTYPGGKTGVATEYSIGVNIGGKDIEIPTLVPTLTKEEVDLMVNDVIPNHKRVPENIQNKAVQHAIERMMKGLSPYID